MDQCHEAGTCDTKTGKCSNPAKKDGSDCKDGNDCTQKDTCQAGKCTGGAVVTCKAKDQCHNAGTCDAKTGKCSNPAKKNGVSCNDNNACTTKDSCQNGNCESGKPVVCKAKDQCHLAGKCDKESGKCSNPQAPTKTNCDDNDKCSLTSYCVKGTCTGTSFVKCTAKNECHDVGTCSPKTGLCSDEPKTGTQCNDGNVCTVADKCDQGSCKSGAQKNCDDKLSCTLDTCKAKAINGQNFAFCESKPASGNCAIDGVCYKTLGKNPANGCQYCNPAVDPKKWANLPGTLNPCNKPGYWKGSEHNFATSPYGNRAAIACHNCYDDNSSSLKNTTTIVQSALNKGADLIEFDIYEHKGLIRVHHDDGEAVGPQFKHAAAYSPLVNATQPLFIELKELSPTTSFINEVLDVIVQHNYARYGRPVVFRTFWSRKKNIELMATALKSSKYKAIAPYVRLHVLYSQNQFSTVSSFQSNILMVSQAGYHGVEFNMKNENLFGLIQYAKSKGLGVAVWTVPKSMGEAYIAGMRNDVDAIIVDYPLDKSRAVVQKSNGLMYLNTATQKDKSKVSFYRKTNKAPAVHSIGGAFQPTLSTWVKGEDLFGGVLNFVKSKKQTLKFFDDDNDTNAGYLITAVVNFDALSLSSGETQSIFAKTDSGGIGLELNRKNGISPTTLRFVVHVGGKYHYASYSASALDGADSYFIICAYDGNGSARMWINNKEVANTSNLKGGGTQNNSPFRAAADPQGSNNSGFHTSAKIQQLSVQKWADH